MTQWPYLHAPKDGYVFIVTYGRSGSTLLQHLLNSITGYCIRGENGNTLMHLARAWHSVKMNEQMEILRCRKEPTERTHPWYGAENTAPFRYGQALADVFVREILQLPEGTRVGGFKEIRFQQDPAFFRNYMEFIRRIFPNARFVFNTRAHDAVARSGWWAEQDASEVARQLQRADSLYYDYAKSFPAKSLIMRYEDYNGNPEGLRPLFDFLNEPFDAETAERVLSQRLMHLKTV